MSGIANIKHAFLDTSIFIYYFEKHPQFGPRCKVIFEKLAYSKMQASTSIITLTELLSAPHIDNLSTKYSEELYGIPNLTVFEVNRKIATEAARIRRTYKFKLGDSIQLATAIHAKARAFISNDQRIKNFKEIPVILLSKI